MPKGNKKQNIPKSSELLGKSTPEEETPEPKETLSLEDIVNNLLEEMRAKAIE